MNFKNQDKKTNRCFDIKRRSFNKLILSGAALGIVPPLSRAVIIGGIDVGTISYSFRDIPKNGDTVGTLIEAFQSSGIDLAELTNADIEPLSIPRGGRVPTPISQAYLAERERVRQSRLSDPIARYEEIAHRFASAGIRILDYVMTFSEDFTDEEIDKTMQVTRALGVDIIGTNQTRVPMAEYLVPFAEEYDMKLSFHNHSSSDDPNEVASVESYERLFELSDNYMANLDVGHFVGGNNSPLPFIDRYHDRITHLHLKDREFNDGPNHSWGEGHTPLVEILRMLKNKNYSIPCIIEYEYRGEADPISEVRRCADFIRDTLA
jgi:sugar phosphate isomerase/epimerase